MNSVARTSPVTLLPLLTFVVSAWVAAALFYQDLPHAMPTHWSLPDARPNGFTEKPWGPFVIPLTMTLVWMGRRFIWYLSLPRHRVERFPGAFDFRIMLTVGLLYAIWTLVITQSVFWLRAMAIPAAVALIVAGGFLATVPFSALAGLGAARLWAREADWLRARRIASVLSLVAGVGILAVILLGT